MLEFFYLLLILKTGTLASIHLPDNDYYVIKERFVLTSNVFADDYDQILPYEPKEMTRGQLLEEIKPINRKPKNTAQQIDYDYFYDKNATREKKQLIESNYTEIEDTTRGNNLTVEKTTFNYTENEDEGLSSWIFRPIDPQNCNEGVGFSLTALRCINSTQGSQKAYILTKFIIFWIIIDLAILFLFWCTKGWCCCCCPFQFCQVNKRINETQRFLAYNPPGEWTDEDGKHHEYDPSPEEKLIYENMSRSFMII